ncbi:hypothetical protein OBK28_12080 [Empedobacter falsenii]
MAKDFKGGLDSILGEGSLDKPNAGRGRPKTSIKVITKSTQEGTKEGESRATFIVNDGVLEKLKAIAYWDRVLIKEVVNSALVSAIEKYEKKNGEIKPIPKK